MAPIVQIPKINDIKFVPEFVSIPEKYSRISDDKTWFKDSIRRWQGDSKYKQKRQFSDRQNIVIGAALNTFGAITLEIWDDCGNLVVDDIDTYFSLYTPGKARYTDDNGNVTDLGLHYWNFATGEHITTPGVYYYVIRLAYSPDRLYISEPIYVRSTWAETVVIECRNDTNKGETGVIFNFIPNQNDSYLGTFSTPTFRHRVEGDIISYVLQDNTAYFEEQDFEVRQMSSYAWKEPILNIGGSEGVPMYLFDKINAAFTCERVYINDTRYTKANGANWQMNEGGYSPLYNGEINIRIYNKQDEVTDVTGNVITLFEEPVPDPATAPYYIYVMGLVGAPIFSGEYVADLTYLNQLKAYIQDDVPNILGLRGAFSFTSGVWTYQNAYGENFEAMDFIVLTTPLIVDITTVGTNKTFAATMVNIQLSSYGGMVWGDGTWGNYSAGSNTSNILSHTYAAGSSYTVRIFASGSQERLNLLRQDRTSVIENIRGYLPPGCNEFLCSCAPNVEFANLTDGLSLEFLASARFNLKGFSITYGAFTKLDGNVFADYPSIGIVSNSSNWVALQSVSFYRCKLTTAEVDDLLICIYDFTPKISLSYIDLQQLPAAPLADPIAIGYKAALIFNGVTVSTN